MSDPIDTLISECRDSDDCCPGGSGACRLDVARAAEAEAVKAAADQLTAARRLLAEDQQQRAEACNAEIEEVLARHGMRLQITQPQITIVPA